MKATVLSVGTEILFGQIVNTNTVYLSRQLNLLGFDVMYHFTVGDNTARLEELLKSAFRDTDIVIMTGGLGPTEDDLTKETVAQVLDDELEMEEESLQNIFARAKNHGYKLTENNFKQAMLPSRAMVFHNERGTAPGFALEKDGKIAVCMPGPPKEMTYMWENQVRPFLTQFQDSVITYRTLNFFGIGESHLETVLLPLIDRQTDPTIATYAHEGECSVRVASKRSNIDEAEAAIEETVKEIKKLAGKYLYSENGNQFNMEVGRQLIDRNISFSVCESCTGGLFASSMVEVPGISKVFDRGLVTYSWKAKQQELGVKLETLEKYSAESREVALEMVRGLKDKTGSRLCLSVTGVAGPEAYEDNPAGHMFIGIIFDDQEKVIELNTGRSDRDRNRKMAYLNMLKAVDYMINGKY